MIGVEQQEQLFLEVGRRLKKKITAYAIGGTAMMFHGTKTATKDIDLVFDNIKEREAFKNALIELGYSTYDTFVLYGQKPNHPEMMSRGDERFDLFVDIVIKFFFSDTVKSRAGDTFEFENFILKIADWHDIVLMKCATDRPKDMEDVKNIIGKHRIDWNILITEAQNQIKLGEINAALDLGEFLERLVSMGVKVSQKVLNELFAVVEKQIKEKIKK